MPILFITLNATYAGLATSHGFNARVMNIQDYVPDPNKTTYYVSPANSLCFMDGGIDYALSRIVFPGIEPKVKRIVKRLNITSIVGKPYLPIGSSIVMKIADKSALVVAPTMLLPQNVSNTKNAYYATMAILHHLLIHKKENLDDIDILFTSLCCGYGKMNEKVSFQQILDGIRDYPRYQPKTTMNIDTTNSVIIHKPTLHDQPKYYQNTEFFSINPEEIIKC